MATALEFLQHILPDEGYKCATIFGSDGKPKRQKFFISFTQLADEITTQDALGYTSYHACSAFATTDNRKQNNVLVAQAFWLDVDAGEGKPYADGTEAWRAVVRFCDAARLPRPLFVSSGAGLHTYWPLVEALEPVEWLPRAERLHLLCQELGLHIDPARTRDLSSILRTPGTHNRKRGAEELVRCGDLEGPFELDELGAINVRPNGVVSPLLRSERGARELVSGPARRSLVDAGANIFTEQPSDPDLVINGCGQVGQLYDHDGCTPEPHWYACLGVLVHATGGRAVAHELSSGHPQYSEAETDERLDRAAEFGPTTCAHFERVNAAGCIGCPFKGKISTPLQLGRSTAEARIRPEGVQVANDIRALPTLGADAQAIVVPEGYRCDHEALWFTQDTNKGEANDAQITGLPIYLEAVQTGETHDGYSFCFRNQVPQEGWVSIVIGAGELAGPGGMAALRKAGAIVRDAQLFRNYVDAHHKQWLQQNRRQMRYDQFGWKENDSAFLFGTALYRAGVAGSATGSTEIHIRGKELGPNVGGSLERWSAAANALFARGCEPQSFALLASFAAPFMRFHTETEGGAVVSLVTDQSGRGKTTALEAVASVWGRLKGTQLTSADTQVSKGLLLGVLGNLPCTYDELHLKDPELIYEFVQAFTNGRDRLRGTVDGTIKHTKAEWQTLLFTASNISLADTLMATNGKDAMQFRVLEFPVDIPKELVKQGDALKNVLRANSGHAGDTYLRYITQPQVIDYAKASLPRLTDELWKKTQFDPEHRFWIRTLASVALAGSFVKHLGLLECSPQRVIDWAIEQLKQRAGDATVTGKRNAAGTLAEFLGQHIDEQLVMPEAFRPGHHFPALKMPHKHLSIRFEMKEGRLFILENALRQWLLKHGVNRTSFLQELKAAGILERDTRRVTLGAGTPLASGQVTAVQVNMNHPAMSGVVADIEKLIPAPDTEVKNTREERIASIGRLTPDAKRAIDRHRS